MRNYKVYNLPNNGDTLADRVISALTYLTMGLVGFIWVIVSFVSGKTLKPFVKFHIFQSIFISVIFYLLKIILGIILGIVKFIPIIGNVVLFFVFYLAQFPVIFGLSLISALLTGLIIYLAVTAFMGKYSYIPWVSDNIRGI